MSDWTATRSTVAAAKAALAGHAGTASQFGPWGDALVVAVEDGLVDEAVLDDKVLRILRLAARVGALTDAPEGPAAPAAPSAGYGPAEIARDLRAAAAASFVLAGHRGLLPLDRSRLGRVASSGRTPRWPGPSAAAAPPSSRPIRSRRWTACGRPAWT